ncbi:anaphase-promoting complex, subunit 10-domain-containing protein [Radiomyces spectabilis]|uniref:anaphase-promoting complex, subunit 10-domain-containing protein n=1 Tax=Radiomyces spectabilis TaxID=64574 RepID=UPI00221E378A|nr:anaphase-promoting complex, subunit 10-domain-containing protein [Radiomyces spectabilis]KAI8371658.1 anaphase-promoting complex, subunit 10-domain-containing protein [Radiomyces spectabilis]
MSDDPQYASLFLQSESDDLIISEDVRHGSSDSTTDPSNDVEDFLPLDRSDGVEEGDEDDEGQVEEDSAHEATTLRIYESTHPGHIQKQQGAREIGEQDAVWFVSTFRMNWGLAKMRDDNPLTYWQSDSPNPKEPHTIDLFFHRATFIKQVSFFMDYFQDDSYTPKTVSIRGGTTYRDLHEIVQIECEETVGWKNVDLSEIAGEPVRVFHLQIAILSTHLNGRDTHIRQLKIYAVPSPASDEASYVDTDIPFSRSKREKTMR